MATGACTWHRTSVAYFADRCLAVRAPQAGCTACVDVCPTHAIRAADRQIVAASSCIACGRCASACPTAAIEVAGFTVAVTPGPDSAAPSEIECRRLPRRAGTSETVRVPCLGGLGAADLLELRRAAGDRPIALIDRGWCIECPAGGAEHPAGAAVAAAAALLAAMGAAALAPTLVCRPLPQRRAAGVDDHDAPAEPARRAVLRRLAGAEAGPAAGDLPPVHRIGDAQPLDPIQRRRQETALAALALRFKTTPPPATEPTVTLSGQCQNHQVCVRVCPTGALASVSATATETLVFDESRCIVCGACARSCPEAALTVTAERPDGDDDKPARVLAQHRRRGCHLCHTVFAAAGEETLCPDCRKTRAFALAGITLRFGKQPADALSDAQSIKPAQDDGGSLEERGRSPWMD